MRRRVAGHARLAAPFVLLVCLFALGVAQAPAVAYLIALVVSYGLVFFAMVGL